MPSPELRWLRLSLVFVWLWTAFASLWEWNGRSLALLAALPDTWPGLKHALIGAGAATDALLGVWLWWRPGRPAYSTALLVMGIMTALATAIDPGWWLHPLGPLSKNLPIAAALLVLWSLDSRA
ncbi:DoxX-like family protein [Hydrogenophaga sp.]|uniref:DoxX-like family protein n=1 Tax=Hydrogenophaga sp. TaxID=1904254 RepID=UPI00286EA426|nr:DoxX-like family protein [Hydrogenophaga sp.]